MSVFFTVGEVFEIALQIERNGARFYRNAAAQCRDKETRDLLLQLAAMEDDHETVFGNLMGELVGAEEQPDWFDRDEESFRYLQSFASGQVFDIGKEHELAPDADVQAVLEFAMERERDSILFYLGIKEWVPRELMGNRIEKILVEEMKHLSQLNNRRLELSAA